MNKMRWLGMGSLVLYLMLGSIHCAGKKSQLKMEPSEKPPPKEEVILPPPEITPPSAKAGEARPIAVAEAPQPEKPVQPPAQPMQPGLPTPPPAAASPLPSSQPARPTEAPKGPGVVFNFDNADLYEVIRVMAEILKINYIIDPKVKGVVNIHTAGQIPAEDIFPIFQSILRLNGATAVKKDNVYEIVPFGDAKKSYVPPSTTREPGKLPTEERYTTQIIALKYIPVAEVSKIIKPFLSDGADIIEHPANNILIINDLASNVRKSLDIINLFDVDLFADMKVRIYPVHNADVTEIAKEMERIFSSLEVSTKSGRGVGITFTPIARINSLLVVSSIPNVFDKVEGWLRELDKTPMEGTKLTVFVYYVQNAKAKDLAEVLKQIFVAPKEKKPEFREKVVTPTPEPTPRGVKPPTPAPTPAPAAAAKEEAAAVPEGEINVVVDEANNALVIRALQRDYRTIMDTIRKLDIYPKQVLVDVFIAAVTLDESNKFGIEWARFVDGLRVGKYQQAFTYGALSDAVFPGAGTFRYSIVDQAGNLTAAIKLAATENRLKVISSPHILASNNKEAKIQIGTSQPILTSTYTTTATATTNVVEGTIEYRDVGIILTVTPRISDAGLISLDLEVERSDADSKSLGNLENVPFFLKRTAKTTLSVLEGQTIVIGGLIEDNKDSKKSGLPWLSKIPILGALFGAQEYGVSRTELIILMTPHIVTDHMQSKTVTEEFKNKVERLKKELEIRGK
jgi:general secretion pathway protein D